MAKLVFSEAGQENISGGVIGWARDHIALAQTHLQPKANLNQELIPRCGPSQWLRALEAIDISQQNRVMETGGRAGFARGNAAAGREKGGDWGDQSGSHAVRCGQASVPRPHAA